MIVEALLSFGFALFGGLIAAFPDGGAPGWLDDGAGMLSDLSAHAAGMGVWFPFGLAGTVLAAVLSCMVIGFGIKLVRIVISLFTAGGGSAA